MATQGGASGPGCKDMNPWAECNNPVESGKFEKLMEQVNSADVSTKPNKTVVYSGPGNRELATKYAELNGKTTLEMTPGGQWLDNQDLWKPGKGLSLEQVQKLWDRASERFAQQASGEVTAFVDGASSTGTFSRIEEPVLKARNITINRMPSIR